MQTNNLQTEIPMFTRVLKAVVPSHSGVGKISIFPLCIPIFSTVLMMLHYTLQIHANHSKRVHPDWHNRVIVTSETIFLKLIQYMKPIPNNSTSYALFSKYLCIRCHRCPRPLKMELRIHNAHTYH